jgi:hypothetical protein
MGHLEAFQHYYSTKRPRRNSYPMTSRQKMEFDYYSKTEFGYRAMYMIQEAPPIQMILRLAQLLF